MLISSPPHFSNIHSHYIEPSPSARNKELVIITTPFALPFSSSLANLHKRDIWFKYRYKFMMTHLFKNISSQTIHSSDNSLYLWLLFVSHGDRHRFNLPKSQVLANGIILMWIEIPIANGSPPNNYYLNKCLPLEISSIVRYMSSKFPDLKYISTMRIDSDDCIRYDYLKICNFVLSHPLVCRRPNDYVFYFPNGLNFDLRVNSYSPYIWPESPFMFRKESISLGNIKTIWEYPHDQISLTKSLSPVISTQAMWCLNVGHGNLANSNLSYIVPPISTTSLSFWST